MDLDIHRRRTRLPRGGTPLLPHRDPAIDPRQGGGRRGADPRRHDHLAAHPERARLGDAELAGGSGAGRTGRRCRSTVPGRDAAGERAVADRLQRHDGRPGDRAVRQRRAEAALPAEDRQRRHLLVPGILRTRFRFRPGLAAHARRAQGRQVRHQRPEDLDHAGAVCRLDLLPGAHRSPRRRSRKASRSSWST